MIRCVRYLQTAAGLIAGLGKFGAARYRKGDFCIAIGDGVEGGSKVLPKSRRHGGAKACRDIHKNSPKHSFVNVTKNGGERDESGRVNPGT